MCNVHAYVCGYFLPQVTQLYKVLTVWCALIRITLTREPNLKSRPLSKETHNRQTIIMFTCLQDITVSNPAQGRSPFFSLSA